MPNQKISIALYSILKDYQDVCKTVPLDIYQKASDSSSIGAHMRHVLEFAQVLAEQAKSGYIDYEARSRNQVFEFNSDSAKLQYKKITEELVGIVNELGSDYAVTVVESPGFGLDRVEISSSLGREILFVIQHCVHHFALIKVLAAQDGISFSSSFGVTPATQDFNNLKLANQN